MSQARHIKISIPEPCHEPWSGMTKVDDLHRHCNSCNKVLTDFSGMSDTELVLWFKHSNGNMCGRFSPAQLNRALTLPSEKTGKKKYWLNALWLIPFAWGSKEAKAQTSTPEVIRSRPPVSVITTALPDTIVPEAVKPQAVIKLTGTVVAEETGQKLSEVTVTTSIGVSAKVIRTETDTAGRYTLEIPADSLSGETKVWFIAMGFGTAQVSFYPNEAVNGQVVRDVKFETYDEMVEGKMIIEREPVPRGDHETSFWHRTRSLFSSGKK